MLSKGFFAITWSPVVPVHLYTFCIGHCKLPPTSSWASDALRLARRLRPTATKAAGLFAAIYVLVFFASGAICQMAVGSSAYSASPKGRERFFPVVASG